MIHSSWYKVSYLILLEYLVQSPKATSAPNSKLARQRASNNDHTAENNCIV